MSRVPRRASRPVLLALALLLLLPLTAHAQTAREQLDDARRDVESVRDDLAAATARYEEVWAEVERTEVEVAELEQREAELVAQAAAIEDQLAERARTVFKQGSTATFELLLAAEGPAAAVERAGLIAVVQTRETAGLQEAVAVRTSLRQAQELTRDRRARLARLQAELAELQDTLEDRLDDAQARVRTLELAARRQRHVQRGAQQGIYSCPMEPAVTHFIDSWGFPRSGGRSHKGTDVMGPMGAEVYAFTSGVIARHSSGGLGGIGLYLRGDDGSTYFYTHLQGYAPKGAVGTRVEAGDHIAFNGNTGNARGGAPHIHFERHPGGGAAVNPYPFLAAACF